MWQALANTAPVWAAIEELAALGAPAADRALLATYLATARDDDTAGPALADLVAAFDRGFDRAALIGGLAGAAWITNHVAPDSDELLAACDASLLRTLEAWDGPLDLTHGLVGIGLYFLDRDSAAGARGRALVIEHLASRMRDGTWFTPPEHLHPEERAAYGEGVFDCGVPHGVGGVVGLLRRLGGEPATSLADTGTRWLLAQVHDGVLPAMLVGGRPRTVRTGWCYGAPGALLALGGPAELTGWLAEPPWPTDSLAMCHGASGLMHAANRMYQATRRPAYRDSALAWLDRVVADVAHAPAGDLLDGSTGIALALLAMASDLEPAWDRMLLCDLLS